MRLLCVEDDPQLARQLAEALADAGFVVDTAHDGERADYLATTETYDAVVLDLGLPRRDGLSLLRRWREQGLKVPVLVLTARDGWSDKLEGFRAGADDYVTKPFHLDEVVLRLKALIRRAAGHASPVLACGSLVYDTGTERFSLEGLPLKLTAFEGRVLGYLMHHVGRLVSRSELSEHLYAYGEDKDYNSLEVIVSRLRKKIGRSRIETVRGEGYRLLDPDTDAP